MQKLWISRDIDAPAEALWDLLTQIESCLVAMRRLDALATSEKVSA